MTDTGMQKAGLENLGCDGEATASREDQRTVYYIHLNREVGSLHQINEKAEYYILLNKEMGFTNSVEAVSKMVQSSGSKHGGRSY